MANLLDFIQRKLEKRDFRCCAWPMAGAPGYSQTSLPSVCSCPCARLLLPGQRPVYGIKIPRLTTYRCQRGYILCLPATQATTALAFPLTHSLRFAQAISYSLARCPHRGLRPLLITQTVPPRKHLLPGGTFLRNLRLSPVRAPSLPFISSPHSSFSRVSCGFSRSGRGIR